MPERIQRKRTKGWKMPPNTVSVTRPGKWGNPACVGDYFMVGDPGNGGAFKMSWCKTNAKNATPQFTFIDTPATAVTMFKRLAETGYFKGKELEGLRGKNLACFCALDQPCHADVLLEIANR